MWKRRVLLCSKLPDHVAADNHLPLEYYLNACHHGEKLRQCIKIKIAFSSRKNYCSRLFNTVLYKVT